MLTYGYIYIFYWREFQQVLQAFELMRGQGRLDMYLMKRTEKQEAKQNQTHQTLQINQSALSAKKSEKGTEMLSKSGMYIYSQKKENNNKIKEEKSLNTPSKKGSILTDVKLMEKQQIKKQSLISTPRFEKVAEQLPKIKVQPNYITHREKEEHKTSIEAHSSETQQLNDSILKQEASKLITCPQYLLLSPFDTLEANKLQRKLQQLMTQCTKRRVVQFIKLQTLKTGKYKNLTNLEKVHDEQFWCIAMQKVIGLILTEQQTINGCIRTMVYCGYPQTVELTRLQIFLLVAGMFLCIIPSQTYTNQTSFYDLMSIKAADEKDKHKPPVRLEKLKCVINYLKFMSEHEEIYEQKVVFQRAVSYDKEYLSDEKSTPLGSIQVECGKIQEGYGEGAMIDFANAAVGGGFLGNGCAQQEILFSIFPELSVIKLICQDLRQEEALVIRGARRINEYEGYSYSFKCRGITSSESQTDRSLIIAVDAMDFTKGLLTKASQYSKMFILRELHKLFVGVEGSCSDDFWRPKKIYTGRWGCGVFGADEYLKFCIQWIVCSHLRLDMVFMTGDQDTAKKLRLLARNLANRTTHDLLSLLLQYGKEGIYGVSLLSYFKDYS